MTLIRQLKTPTRQSAFPVIRASEAEIAAYGIAGITDRFVPETLGLAGNNDWKSIRPRTEGDADSASRLILEYGEMPTLLPTGGPNGTPAVRWPLGKLAIFRADGITVPTTMEGSFTIAAVWKPRTYTDQASTLAATRGTRNTSGISFWGSITGSPASGPYIYTHTTQYTADRVGVTNVTGSEFDDGTGKGWVATIWTRRGGATSADLQTYYGKTVDGVFQWVASPLTGTLLPLMDAELMVGGSLEHGSSTAFEGLSSSYDTMIADLIIMNGSHVIDDTPTLTKLGNLWFDKYFS